MPAVGNAVGREVLLEDPGRYRRVFFFRACGAGMAAAAALLKDLGLEVEGGDHEFRPPASDALAEAGIPRHRLDGLGADHYRRFDLVVVGNVVAAGSRDAALLEGLGLPLCSFPAAVGALALAGRDVVGFAGTHGKTTTAWLAVQVFEALGAAPGFLVGGSLPGRLPAAAGGGGPFLIEADEYDGAWFEKVPKFHSYSVARPVVTSLEFDHGDVFGSVGDIEAEFGRLLRSGSKRAVVCGDYPSTRRLLDAAGAAGEGALVYGEGTEAGPHGVRRTPGGTAFSLGTPSGPLDLETSLTGGHNVRNLTAVVLAALDEGHPPGAVARAARRLGLPRRRQEPRGLHRGGAVIDDFAHHPRAVAATIEAVRADHPGKALNVVFEPSSATARSDVFQEAFGESLAGADRVLVLKPERPSGVPGAGDLDPEALAGALGRRGVPAAVAGDLDGVVGFIDRHAGGDAVVLVMGNGAFRGLWGSDFAKSLA